MSNAFVSFDIRRDGIFCVGLTSLGNTSRKSSPHSGQTPSSDSSAASRIKLKPHE